MKENFFEKFFNKKVDIQIIKLTADVVVDTNVLLSAYQWKEVTLNEVIEVMDQLSEEGRLKIPSHVFNEFVDQRPKRIAEIIQKIDVELLNKIQKPSKLVSVVPFLDMLVDSEEYLKLEQELIESRDKYYKKVKALVDTVKSFFLHDPVLDMFQSVIQKGYFELDTQTMATIDEEAKIRSTKKIPPLTGGDSTKKENAFGDYIIWKHILSLKNDVLFVTADKKDDWALKDHHGNVLSPRRELVEEFYEISGGKSFSILTPKQFVELYKPEVSKGITEDLEVNNEQTNIYLRRFFRTIFNSEDPMALYALAMEEDAYDLEISEIIRLLHGAKTLNQLNTMIYQVFVLFFTEDSAGNEELYRPIAEKIWKIKDFRIV